MTADELAKLIPDEVVQQARVAWLEQASDYTRLDESIRAALAAGLAAWSGTTSIKWDGQSIVHLKMPLAKETPNAK
jgi:hypothetical protein